MGAANRAHFVPSLRGQRFPANVLLCDRTHQRSLQLTESGFVLVKTTFLQIPECFSQSSYYPRKI